MCRAVVFAIFVVVAIAFVVAIVVIDIVVVAMAIVDTSGPLQSDGCKLTILLTFHINSTPIWRLGKHLLIIENSGQFDLLF